MTTRVAIYARYSSENQKEASIDDQVRTCRARADREGWIVSDIYTDYAVSGASTRRPGFQAMMAASEQKRFDVVLSESLDRLSRDQEHIAAFCKAMMFAAIRIVTVADGDINELHIGLKGTMSALFLKDLAQKTHRGIEGRVRAGRSGGGLCFGYKLVRQIGSDGQLVTGELSIDAREAHLTSDIYDQYCSGRSPRSIARDLNRASVPGPRNGK